MSAAPVLTQYKRITVEVASGPLKGKVYHFSKPHITIGRDKENDLVFEEDAKISRSHIEIRQEAGMVTIHNITEKNTALLNGMLVQNAALEPASRLMIGETELFIHLETNQLAPVQSQPALTPLNTLTMAGFRPPTEGTNGAAPKLNFQAQQRAAGREGSPKLLLYVLIGFVVLVIGFITSQTVAKHRRSLQIKTTEEVEQEVKLSTDTVEDLNKRFEEEGVDSRGYQTAQQQYVRGYRDYNQGQYSRAIHELSAAVTYYPQHKLAQRYLALAQKKLDELVKAEFELGQKYRGQQSYRRCSAAFKKVITLLDDLEDKTSKDAEKIMQECDLQQREHY